MIDLVEQLVERREALGWTQAELARRSDVTQPQISQIETGERDPAASTMQRLTDAMGGISRVGWGRRPA